MPTIHPNWASVPVQPHVSRAYAPRLAAQTEAVKIVRRRLAGAFLMLPWQQWPHTYEEQDAMVLAFVASRSDDDLLAISGIGRKRLALLREAGRLN